MVKKTFGMKGVLLEDLTATYEQLGVVLRKQLDKLVLFRDKGPWAAIAFKYQNKKGDGWEEPKVMLAFFKKVDGFYMRYSYFNIRSKKEAMKIIVFLAKAFEI